MPQIAQLNVGRVLYPMTDPRMAGFANELDRINALAEASPGFVWRLKDDSGNATGIQTTDDPAFLVNLSVWETVASLRAFVYGNEHRTLVAQRRDWFERADAPILVLWPVAEGHRPTAEEALAVLARFRAEGPSSSAFDFRTLPAEFR
ncbi:MAG: DUF3291 domain-containing protein [Pseudomonadota bacterium]